MSCEVAAPALPVVEDLLDALVGDVLARLEAAAAAIGVPAAHIHDHPVDPIPEDRLPAIEVAAAEEIEEFTVNGTPWSPRTQAQVLVMIKTGTAKGWRRKAFALRHRVRVALLTDPACCSAGARRCARKASPRSTAPARWSPAPSSSPSPGSTARHTRRRSRTPNSAPRLSRSRRSTPPARLPAPP